MKKGMSLIVLVITILVMIILAGVVVVGISDNNPIESANTAKALSEVGNYAQSVNLYASNKLSKAYDTANGTAKDTKLVAASNSVDASGTHELETSKGAITIDPTTRKATYADEATAKPSDAKYYFPITAKGYTAMDMKETVLNNAMYVVNCNGNLKLLINTDPKEVKVADGTYAAEILNNANVVSLK